MLHIIADSMLLASGSHSDGPSHVERPRRRSGLARLFGRILRKEQTSRD